MPAQFGVQHHTWSRTQISAEHYGCHFDDLTVDRSHLYDNDNIKTSWSEVYAALDGEGGGRQGCGLDLAPFWYTSPFKLSAPFHLISPLSVGFPRNRFCHVSVSWRLLVVYESIQIKSTILIAFSTVLQRNTLFVPWALGDFLLLYTSPLKIRPLFGRFDRTISDSWALRDAHFLCISPFKFLPPFW